MARGRHCVEPAERRQLPRPSRRAVAAAAGGAVLATCVGFAAGPVAGLMARAGAGDTVVVAAGEQATSAAPVSADLQLVEVFRARDRAEAGRGAARPAATPTAPVPAAASASATEPAADPTTPAAATPSPAAPAPVPAVVGRLWATTTVNIRSGPSTDTDRIGQVAALTQVDVTGAVDNGWTQVVTDGRAGWVTSSYLSQTQPTPQATAAAAGLSDAACAISPGIEVNLTADARAVYRAVCAAYGASVSSFGGYRPGDGGDHGAGRAVDIMVSGEPGWEIARYVQAHAPELGVAYVIYQQQIWQAGRPAGAWTYMEDRGSVTANHYDHVHVSVS